GRQRRCVCRYLPRFRAVALAAVFAEGCLRLTTARIPLSVPWRQVMHRRPVDYVDSRVRSQTYGLKKNCTAFSAVRGWFAQIQTRAPTRGSSYVSFVAQPAFIGPPHPPVGLLKGVRG